jgi:hypothetical protein
LILLRKVLKILFIKQQRIFMKNKYLILLIAIVCSNISYGMEEGSLASLQHQQLLLLQQDDKQMVNITETLSIGVSPSKICFYTALGGVGCGVLACIANDFRIAGMAVTLFAGSTILGLPSMHNEQKTIKICNEDLEKIRNSILQIGENKPEKLQNAIFQSQTQIISATCQINNEEQLPQLRTSQMNIFGENYAKILKIIEKLTIGFSHSKICFYITLAGLGICSLAWLNSEKSDFPMGRIGSVLFLGAGGIGAFSIYNDQQKLTENMKAKAALREKIMQINKQ